MLKTNLFAKEKVLTKSEQSGTSELKIERIKYEIINKTFKLLCSYVLYMRTVFILETKSLCLQKENKYYKHKLNVISATTPRIETPDIQGLTRPSNNGT